MLSHECDIYQLLHLVMPGVSLSLHHLMDMDHYYPESQPMYDIGTQVERALALQSESGGSLKTFVAFDPSRADGLAVVEEALAKGCVGVKFYPPNGYRPLGNGDPVDERNRKLFDLCQGGKIPLFTHCTPAGFESMPGYGRLSDPVAWRLVMKEFPTLRLCLGHAGGAADWTSGDELGPYARTVIDLCESYEQVYCEFGHFEEILEDDSVFVARLAEAIDGGPPPGGYSLADKIMFGSDWHIMAMFESEPGSYRRAFETAFANPSLAPYSDGFFASNAEAYLGTAAP